MLTIPGTLRMSARRVPDAPAVVFEDRRYTYAELDAAVDRCAAVLASYGLQRGDRLALMAANSDHFVITFYAALRLGGIFVPVNPSSAPPEVQHILADCGATIFVHGSTLETARAAVATDRPESLTAVLTLDQLAEAAAVLEEGSEGGSEEVGPRPQARYLDDDYVTPEDDALIMYTSGTTGRPKGALQDHRRMLNVAFGCVAACGMKAGDRFLHVAPLYHAAELGIMLIPGTELGVLHVIQAGFEPTAVAETMERERITMFFGPPTMYQFLLRTEGIAERDLSAWRTGLYGAAPMPTSAAEELLTAFPRTDFMNLAGQTEGGPSGIYSSTEQVRQRPDASGRQALPLTECQVVDEAGDKVEPGQVGELLLRGETIMKGYWNKPEETAQTLRGGWLHTGDLVRVDDDGFMTFVDRLKDMIITGGLNVYSIEVENAVAAHPHVIDVAVVARPHDTYGESIVAVVTLREGATLTLDELRTHCADHLAHYKIPHDLVVAGIPRNPSGKVLKNQLRETLQAAPSQQSSPAQNWPAQNRPPQN